MTVQLLGNRNFLISQNEVMLGKGGTQKPMPGVLLRKPHGDPVRGECGMMAEADRGVTCLPTGKY